MFLKEIYINITPHEIYIDNFNDKHDFINELKRLLLKEQIVKNKMRELDEENME